MDEMRPHERLDALDEILSKANTTDEENAQVEGYRRAEANARKAVSDAVNQRAPQALADALRRLTGARQVAVAYDRITEDGRVVPGDVAISRASEAPDAACLGVEGCQHTRDAEAVQDAIASSFADHLLRRLDESTRAPEGGFKGILHAEAAVNKILHITDEQVAAVREKVMRDIGQAMDIPASFVTPPLPPRDEQPFRFFAPKVEPPNPVRRYVYEDPEPHWWATDPTADWTAIIPDVEPVTADPAGLFEYRTVRHGKGCTEESGCSDECVTGTDL